MEMTTPLTLRDIPVSSGDGAKPHGRDLSSSEATATAASTEANQLQLNNKTTEVIEKQELPIDPTTEALAARLRMADPHLDAKAASKIAKQLMSSSGSQWETNESAKDPHGQINVKG